MACVKVFDTHEQKSTPYDYMEDTAGVSRKYPPRMRIRIAYIYSEEHLPE